MNNIDSFKNIIQKLLNLLAHNVNDNITELPSQIPLSTEIIAPIQPSIQNPIITPTEVPFQSGGKKRILPEDSDSDSDISLEYLDSDYEF